MHIDPRDGKDTDVIPNDHKQRSQVDPRRSIREKIKGTMKSVQSPYEPFESYYPLNDVIDTYMEIWFNSDSDSSEGNDGCSCCDSKFCASICPCFQSKHA
jgi:hypothetical protein